MSLIGAALVDCLGSVERPGDFCVSGRREIFMPTIDVEGMGRIAFPLLALQAERLVEVATAAPHGRGEETVVDRDVRRTWQIESDRVQIAGRQWDETLAGLVAETAAGLGVSTAVEAVFYKLLIYDAGSFFVDHRDTEKMPGMFATLAIVLPSTHTGGDLVVRHLGREVVVDLHPEEPSEIGFVAFYADCLHTVRPVVSGWRMVLIYNLRFLGEGGASNPPDYRAEQARVTELLSNWAKAADEPDKLILPLEHAYTPAEMSFSTLKGADAAVASVVLAAAAADCAVHLALVSIGESGSAEYTGYYGRRSRRGGDQEDDDAFEVGEVFDRWLHLSCWRSPDGGEVGWDELPFDEDELCPPDAFDDLTPDEQNFHEATGNEGASFERTFRRAGLVLWPRARRLAVLNQGGLAVTLPYLEDITGRWQAEGADVKSPLWREADELSLHMLRAWPQRHWLKDDSKVGGALDLLARLRNAARIDAFLAELPTQGNYAASDNEAIVRAATMLPRRRATELLVQIVEQNAAARLAGCGDLLLRCVTASAGIVGDPERVGAALLDAMPGDPERRRKLETWQRPAMPPPGFVVDLLTALSRIDETDAGLAMQAVELMLAWPGTYPADKVLVPASVALARRPETKSWPAARRLREVCVELLRQRTAEPLQAPQDWARANRLRCNCEDCRGLGEFLVDSRRHEWRLKAAQRRRDHVADSARNAGCDVDLKTERRGSPHTLVVTKNQASYERSVLKRKQGLEHLAALGGNESKA
jgi:predicted 2-oxoglutarate/Fe(II)-dependent dioxygenase YbiX